jgi:hypothetical protein
VIDGGDGFGVIFQGETSTTTLWISEEQKHEFKKLLKDFQVAEECADWRL